MIDRIIPIITAGKTIRGSLVLLSYCFTNKTPSEDAIKLAAAMELIQTALVIHDDIMDHDNERRGIPTLHVQYTNEALAMCAGDILFFLAFELIGDIQTDETTLGRIVRLIGREYQCVGVAQMADIAKSAKTKLELLNLYTYKTARYTFTLPLMAGATLAGDTKETLRYLESYGVETGVLFQIQDDVLDNEKNLFTHSDRHAYKKAAQESLERLIIQSDKKQVLENLLKFVMNRKK